MRLGPDADYVNTLDYTVGHGESRIDSFAMAASRFLRGISAQKLVPDYAGIRPKLAAAGEPARDFLIAHEESRGMPGLVNLLGIESPGLTSSLAIADYVASLLNLPPARWIE